MTRSFNVRSFCCFLGWLRLFLLVPASSLALLAQTDETIFREFQFDFSTPGARANAMGRAFVGLADEATAAYSNPAGLSVLKRPELSLEFRHNTNGFGTLENTDTFTITQGTPTASRIDLRRLGFGSFSFSWRSFNFSAFFINNLDYRREEVNETTRFLHNTDFYTATYINQHHVRQIEVNTTGLGISRNFGRLDLGIALGAARLDLDFNYRTSLDSADAVIEDLVISSATGSSTDATLVLGALYEVHPTLNIGFSYKRQPRFTYVENINNFEFPPTVFPEGEPIEIVFKVPDSFQIGFGYQPNDRWTVLFDLDWIRYQQLLGNNLTFLSRIRTVDDTGPVDPFFTFDRRDFKAGQDPDIRLGAEYLIPTKKYNFAVRLGGFLDPDHKTRFVGTPEANQNTALYEVQNYIFNTDDKENNLGFTAGLGVLIHNRLQWDVAIVESDRFRRVVTSFLYRF